MPTPRFLADKICPVRAKRERRKEARPGELLAAALDLFVEKGYAATRSEEVAVRAGVSKGTLFLYFPSKEELFKAVVEGLTVDQVNAAVRPVFEGQGPVVMVTTPVPIEGGEAAVTAALEASRQTPVVARADEAALEWPYTDFATPTQPTSAKIFSKVCSASPSGPRRANTRRSR